MFAVKAKFYGAVYNQSSSIAFDETSSYWSAQKKTPNFSAFHWSLRGSLVFIGQHFVTTRVVHLPAEQDRNKLNFRLGPKRTRLCGPCIVATAGFVYNLIQFNVGPGAITLLNEPRANLFMPSFPEIANFSTKYSYRARSTLIRFE